MGWGAGPRKSVGAVRLGDRAGRERLAIAKQRVLLPGESGKFRAGDPGALNEFELPRDIGLEANEVDANLGGGDCGIEPQPAIGRLAIFAAARQNSAKKGPSHRVV